MPLWTHRVDVALLTQHGDLFQTHSAVIFRHPFSEKKTRKTPLKMADQVGRQDSLLQWAQKVRRLNATKMPSHQYSTGMEMH